MEDKYLEKIKKQGIKVLEYAPDGYKKLEGATTQPRGYSWYSNGKSRFSKDYVSVLVKESE